jgi:hypothetical protein
MPDNEPSTLRAVHRVYLVGNSKFQLRKGEEGLSVFDAEVVKPEDILPRMENGGSNAGKILRMQMLRL